MNDFEPKILCFLCKWCTYAGADLAGTSRMQYPPNGVVIKTIMLISNRLRTYHYCFQRRLRWCFIGGCHPGDCHYQSGNYKTQRRIILLKKFMEQMGINPQRLHLEWISASEGKKFANTMIGFTEQIKDVGPLPNIEI